MAKNKAYYEEVNMKNQLHLREILDELPLTVNSFLLESNLPQLPGRVLHMRMILIVSLNFFMKTIPFVKNEN